MVVARWLPWAWAVTLSLLLLGPALAPGYVLSYDMVFVPDLALRSDLLGLGTALPRAVPSDAVVALLDQVVPGMALQKVVLLGALVLAGLGSMRLVAESLVARLVAVSVTIWSPFVVERLWIGHWPVLLGYAVAPWLVVAGRRCRLERRIPASVFFLLPLGSLSANAGLVSATILLATGVGRDASQRLRTVGWLLLTCLASNAPWLIAGLLHASSTGQVGGYDVFGLRSEGKLPAPLTALGLGGIWNAEVVPASRESALAWVGLVMTVLLAVAGWRTWWLRVGPRHALALVGCWLLGYGLALTTWLAPDAVAWVGDHVPGAGLLRDGTRSLTLCLPLLVSLVATGADVVVGRVRERVPAVALTVACVLFPVMAMTDAAWGLGRHLESVEYPASFAAARTALAEQANASSGDVLVLPFTSYRAPGWNMGRKVLDPLGRYLTPNYVANDELSVSGNVIGGEDRRAGQVQAALQRDDPRQRASALGALGIGFVASEKDAGGDAVTEPEVAGAVLYDDSLLRVTKIEHVDARTPSGGWRAWMSVAGVAFAAVIVAGLVRIALGIGRRRRTHQ
jgi:hypothetical protein